MIRAVRSIGALFGRGTFPEKGAQRAGGHDDRAGEAADLLERFQRVVTVAGKVLPEYRFKWPQMAWWSDAPFTRYLSKFGEVPGFNSDRRWMVRQLLRLVADVPGHTAECGVYTGGTSWLIACANAASGIPRVHYGFDSFQGLSRPSTVDGTHWVEGDLSADYEEVSRRFARFGDSVQMRRGWVPEVLEAVRDHTFAFLHIDVDLYAPTRDSLEFFYPRLQPGAVVVCDDYGFTSCPGATAAVDEVMQGRPEQMLALPCGGGFFIRGISASKACDLMLEPVRKPEEPT